MSFRLIRGCDPELIFDHFRRRTHEEGRRPDIDARYNCSLEPGPQQRERSTLQTASVTSRAVEAVTGEAVSPEEAPARLSAGAASAVSAAIR
jgi:hypothetical protein